MALCYQIDDYSNQIDLLLSQRHMNTKSILAIFIAASAVLLFTNTIQPHISPSLAPSTGKCWQDPDSILQQKSNTDNIQQEAVPSISADGKVQVDLYSESLCPDCLQFIRSSLKTAANTKDFWKICNFNLYPYGNARRTSNGTAWSFTCQHGQKQCLGNMIEACAIRNSKFDYYSQSLPFAICLEDNTTDFTIQGQRCAAKYSMDWQTINSCVNGPEGNRLMYEIAVATENLNPKHTYVPWIVVNGQHSTSSENAIIKNMVQYVCSIYSGPEKIAACK